MLPARTGSFAAWVLLSGVLLAGHAVRAADAPGSAGTAPRSRGVLLAEAPRGSSPRGLMPRGSTSKAGPPSSAPGASAAAPATAPAAKAPTALKGDDASRSAGKESAADVGAAPSGFAQKLVRFLKRYGTWIILALGALIAAVAVWTVVGARRGGGSTERAALEDLGFTAPPKSTARASDAHKRFSSTRIQKSAIDGRTGKGVTSTEVETDREYALVVDEEALKLPPLPEEHAEPVSSRAADGGKIRTLVDARKYREAYDHYARQLRDDPSLRFAPDLENALGEGLIRARDYDKAVRVLERRVSGRKKSEVSPETFFNLGYAHFMTRSLPKARHFFQLFIEIEKDPALVARARGILEKIRG